MAEAEAWVMIPKMDKNKTGCVLDMRPLVLCKDCKYNDEFGCHKLGMIVSESWFCADGKSKDI